MQVDTAVTSDRVATTEPATVGAWERLSFATLRAAVYVLARCLTLPGLYRFGELFGFVEWAINFKRRRRFAERLRYLFGDELSSREVRRATLRHFVRVRCDKMVYLIFDLLPRETLLERFEIVNRHLLDEALSAGKGVYAALSHHGAHHIAGLMMSMLGYKVAGVRDRREGAIRRYVQSMYERRYEELRQARIIYSDAFPRDIYRCFQENYALGSALDIQRERDARLKSAEVTFFGRKQRFLTGTVQIALRCGAPILQGFILSGRNFKYRLELHGPLVDVREVRESPELLQDVMQRYADNVERYVRKYPAQISRV